MVQLSILCFCLPTLLLAAPPAEDAIKQQFAAGLMRGDEGFYIPSDLGEAQFRQLEYLGRNLRSLGDSETNWLGSGSNGKIGWRFNGGYNGGLKRGGTLDSLGRGNILRGIPDEFSRYYRSLDSLGRGNILKRSTRESA